MSSGSSKQKSTSTSTSYIPSQKKGITTAIDTYMPTLGQGQPSYSGQRVAGFSPLQQEVFQQAGTNMFMTPEQTEDYYKKTIHDPAIKQFGDEVAPAIREEYAGPGYWSSARANAVADARADLDTALSSQRADLMWNTKQSNNALLPVIYSFGEAQQQQQQQQINAMMQQFVEENRLTNPEDMEILLSLFGIPMSKSEQKYTANSGNPFVNSFLGGYGANWVNALFA